MIPADHLAFASPTRFFLPRFVMTMPATITAIAAIWVQRKLSSPISTVAIVATTGKRYW